MIAKPRCELMWKIMYCPVYILNVKNNLGLMEEIIPRSTLTAESNLKGRRHLLFQV
jgi:hypothetical protein